MQEGKKIREERQSKYRGKLNDARNKKCTTSGKKHERTRKIVREPPRC